MKKLYFKISELCIIDGDIPLEIANKLLTHHIWPMNAVRHELGSSITASQRSGYRPKEYEEDRNRSGNSQHCFIDEGAVDWATSGDIKKMIELIMKVTDYTRICYYPNNGFVHCDYAHADRGRRYFRCASPTSAWQFVADVENITCEDQI